MDSRLKNLRELLDYTQQDLARELGISRQSLIALERGKCKPSIDLAREIADFFEMPIELIFYPESCNKNNPSPQSGAETKGEKMKKKQKSEKSLMPWSGFSPFRELSRMHEEIDRMFEDSFFKDRGISLTSPAIDVVEKSDSVIIKADLPGVEEKDVDIEVHEDYVKIEGERKEDKEVKKENYYHKESAYGSFFRSVALPTQVKPDGAKAKMKNGRLEVSIPKLKMADSKVKKLKPGE